ncbi:MAG: DNA polymerase IV [Candidatus Omnitrophica bacterium]|nr:DNA polymerase IV [Candidatus Omnitrophota bacterium]
MLTRKSITYDRSDSPPEINRIIFHADMDAFFASVEQSANPLLRGKPVLVGGHSLTRGVVTTASYEARPYGIKAGMSLGEARRLCPHAIIVPADSGKYVETSQVIFSKLRQYTPLVEVFSIDEAFLDVTATFRHFFKTPEDLALHLKSWVTKQFRITMSVGIASNKLLAKLASDVRKPNGLFRIHHERISSFLEKLPVETLCGIGPSLKEHLHGMGVRTCGELGRFSEHLLFERFGVIGPVLKNMGMGIDHAPVMPADAPDITKSMGHSYTLLEDIFELRDVKKYLLWLAERVGRRLRRENFRGCVVHLWIRYGDRSSFVRQRACHYDLDDGQDIYHEALKIFGGSGSVWKEKGVRALGVSVSGLRQSGHELWLLEEYEKHRRLRKSLDAINDRFGEFTVKPASINFKGDDKAESDVIDLFGSGK